MDGLQRQWHCQVEDFLQQQQQESYSPSDVRQRFIQNVTEIQGLVKDKMIIGMVKYCGREGENRGGQCYYD